jgi:hypothetical protein
LKRRELRFFHAGALLAITACTLTHSFDEFTGGSLGMVDSGIGVDGGGPAEDASASGDADSGGGVDGGSPPFACSELGSAPLFCADFNSGGLTQGGWQASISPGANLVLEPTQNDSAVRWLHASTPAATVSVEAQLLKHLTSMATRGTLRYDMRVNELGAVGSSAGTTALYFAARVGLELYVGADGGKVRQLEFPDDGGSAKVRVFPLSVPFPLRRWVRVTWEVQIDTVSHLKLSFDDVVAFDGAVAIPKGARAIDLYTGLFYIENPNSPWDVLYDSMVFTEL